MKACTFGDSCTYRECNFNHILSKDDLETISKKDRKTLGTYTAKEDAIKWCTTCKCDKASTKPETTVEIIEDNSSSTEEEDISPVKKPTRLLAQHSYQRKGVLC
jgi:hypothetical protein